MAEQSCDINQAPAQSRYAGEWGLATLLLAMTLVLAAILTLIWSTLFIANLHALNPSRADLRLTTVFTAILMIMFWCLSLVSIFFGRHALRAAWARCQPGGLPLAGTLLAIVALLLWTATAVGLVIVAMDLARVGRM